MTDSAFSEEETNQGIKRSIGFIKIICLTTDLNQRVSMSIQKAMLHLQITYQMTYVSDLEVKQQQPGDSDRNQDGYVILLQSFKIDS